MSVEDTFISPNPLSMQTQWLKQVSAQVFTNTRSSSATPVSARSLFWAQLASLFYLSVSLSGLLSSLYSPTPTAPPVLFQTAGLSRPYLCFGGPLWLHPLIFDLRVPQNLAEALVLSAHGRLFFRATLKGQHFPCLLQVSLQSVTSTDCTSYIPREIQDIRTNTRQGNLANWEEWAQNRYVCG